MWNQSDCVCEHSKKGDELARGDETALDTIANKKSDCAEL